MLNLVIIGCGAVSQELHAPALVELEFRKKISVIGLYDPNIDELNKLRPQFVNAVALSSLDDLSKFNVDLALIASPPKFHAEQAIACLNAGVSVLCEKPMATTIAEANNMLAAAGSKGAGLLAVGHIRRFFPAAQFIRQCICTKYFGALVNFTICECTKFAWPAKSPAFFQRNSGGGVLLDMGIHTLDLLHWWLGTPESISYQDDAMGGIEINCILRIKYRDTQGEVRLSWDYDAGFIYTFHFDQASLSWCPYHPTSIRIIFANLGYEIAGEIGTSNKLIINQLPLSIVNYNQYFIEEWLNLIGAIYDRRPLVSPGSEAIAALSTIDYCYRNRELLIAPWFSTIEVETARRLSRE